MSKEKKDRIQCRKYGEYFHKEAVNIWANYALIKTATNMDTSPKITQNCNQQTKVLTIMNLF